MCKQQCDIKTGCRTDDEALHSRSQKCGEDPDTPEVKAAKEKAEKELRKDFEDELAAAIADEMKKMKKRRYGCSDSR